MKGIVVLLILVLLATQFSDETTVTGDYPKAIIKGQDSVPVGGAVLLDGRDSKFDPTIGMTWQPIDPKNLIILTADKDGKARSIAFFVADHAGRYEVALACAGYDANKRLNISIDIHVVNVGQAPNPGPKPNPGPDPDPNPTPKPDPPPVPPVPPLPISATKWAVVILPTTMTLDNSQIQVSVKIREFLTAKGIGFRVFYEDNKILVDKGFGNVMRDMKPPILVLQDAKGLVLARTEVNSEADIMNVLNRIK